MWICESLEKIECIQQTADVKGKVKYKNEQNRMK